MLRIFKSSAGSGKTYTLVLEYLRLALQSPGAYRRMLAVTFTNKATEEMKNRILEVLSALAAKDPSDKTHQVRQRLADFLSISPSEVDRRSQVLLTNLLQDYSRFSVSTIESFFQRVLRAVAKELNLPMGYDLQLSNAEAIQDAVARTLVQVDAHPVLASYLESYAYDQWQQEKDFRLENLLQNFSQELFRESFQEMVASDSGAVFAKEAIIGLKKQLRTELDAFWRSIQRPAAEGIRMMDELGLTVADFPHGQSSAANLFAKVHRAKPYQTDPKEVEPNDRNRGSLEKENLWISAKNKGNPVFQRALDMGIVEAMADLIERIDAGMSGALLAYRVLPQLPALGVFSDIEESLNAYRRENQTLLISDATRLLRQTVSESDTPFLYEKLANQYQHFLIDEFQDTSDGQWKNFLPLIVNGLATDGVSLLVGDVKQAIYRWRNGNPELLLSQAEADLRGHDKVIVPLTTNYRSAAPVVAFNNQFFSHFARVAPTVFLKGEEGSADGESDLVEDSGFQSLIPQAYADVVQEIKHTTMSGFVQVRLFTQPKRGDEETPDWKEQSWESMKGDLRQILADGYSPEDICFLTRKNEEAVWLAKMLRQETYTQIVDGEAKNLHFKVATAESLLISSHPPVALLAGALNILATPDHNPLTELLLQRVMAQLADSGQGTIGESAFQSRDQVKLLIRRIESERRTLLKMPVSSLINQLAGWLNVDTSDPFYLAFQQWMQEASAANPGGLSACMEQWEKEGRKKYLDADKLPGAIRIMSVHKSKGLEFPVVMMPFANWRVFQADTMWLRPEVHQYDGIDFPLRVASGKDLAKTVAAPEFLRERDRVLLESVNLAYVAFTRARERLYLGIPKGESSVSIAKGLEQTLKEMKGLEGDWEKGVLTMGKCEPIRKTSVHAMGVGDAGRALTLVPTPPRQGIGRMGSDRFRIRRRGSFQSRDLEGRQAKVSRGVLLHDLLSKVHRAEDVAAAVAGLELRGNLSPEDAANLLQDLQEFLTSTAGTNWFSGNWKVLNEAEILTPEGKSWRPDRVMVSPDGLEAVVVDYKTGEKRREHENQVQHYMGMLSQMGYPKVAGWLLYLEGWELHQVG